MRLSVNTLLVFWTLLSICSGARADATRSVTVVVLNGTGYALTLSSHKLAHGVWTPGWEPPESIDNGVTAQWRSESHGFITGNEGEASYRISSDGSAVRFYWDNPFFGSNTYEASAPPALSTAKFGGEGDRTYVQFYVGPGGQKTPCNGWWMISQLRTDPNKPLTDFQKFSGSFSTPFKKAGFSGWVTTGCVADGTGIVAQNLANSTDGLTTIDVKLRSFSVGGTTGGAGKFLRLEVTSNVSVPKDLHEGSQLSFHGPVLIDMDLQSGGLLIFGSSGVTAGWMEVHPDSVWVSTPPNAPKNLRVIR